MKGMINGGLFNINVLCLASDTHFPIKHFSRHSLQDFSKRKIVLAVLPDGNSKKKYGLLSDAVASGHPCDGHLTLQFKKNLFRCDGCKQVGFGKRYTCLNPDCKFSDVGGFCLHMGCARPESRRTHYLYEGRIFEFRRQGKEWKYCDACGGDFEGCFYQGYWDNKGFRKRERRDLHLACMELQPEIHFNQFVKQEQRKAGSDVVQDSYDDVSDVVLVLKKELPSSAKCAICRQKKVHGVKTWVYVSQCNSYAYHVRCLRNKVIESFEDLLLQGVELDRTIAKGPNEKVDWMGSLFGSASSSIIQQPPSQQNVIKGKADASYGQRISRVIKIAKILLSILASVFTGDPITALVTVATTIFSQ